MGSHFEHWGFSNDQIIETDWNEYSILDEEFTSHTTPARHFSGRGLTRNKTLWASFVLITPNHKLYFGGDSGYDNHFAEIGKKFGPFDLALLENGQYDDAWKYIHMHPDEVLKAAKDLKANNMLPGHSGKFDLANHEWNAPLKTITQLHNDNDFKLTTPLIGTKVYLKKPSASNTNWWENSNKNIAFVE